MQNNYVNTWKIRKMGLIILIMLQLLFSQNCKKENNEEVVEDKAAIEQKARRQKVVDDYKNIYLVCSSYELKWTGIVSTCQPGKVSKDFQDKTLKRINYFRQLCGLAVVSFDTTKYAKCQDAALMLTANGQLNHYPPSTWSCFTSNGYDATSHSNLASGAVGPSAVSLYMEDPGSSNKACGHRRWILYPKMNTMSHGSTSSYDCLYVIGGHLSSYPANLPEFIAFPPKEYVPANLVPARWSFSVPKADYTNTTVQMTDEIGNPITLSIVSYKDNGFGDNTIIWEPVGIKKYEANDTKYHVKVNNVKVNNESRNYEYDVILIQIPATKKEEVKGEL